MSWKSRIRKLSVKLCSRFSSGSVKKLDKRDYKFIRKIIIKNIPLIRLGYDFFLWLVALIWSGIVLISSGMPVWYLAPSCGESIGEMIDLLDDFGSLQSTNAVDSCVSQIMMYYGVFMIGLLIIYVTLVGRPEKNAE